MPRKAKAPKNVKVRLRRNSYFKKIVPFAEEWFKNEHPNDTCNWQSTMVNMYLFHEYQLAFRSTSLRKINGEKIDKIGTWSVRVDFYESGNPKLFTLFCLKFAPTVMDKTWFFKK
jgi:hypothetical protein